jgi:translation initiation factor 2 subunit 2
MSEDQPSVDDDLQQFELSLKKKKKKPKRKEEEEEDEKTEAGPGATPWEGSDRDYTYTELLDRVFTLLRTKNPSLGDDRKRRSIPPPQLVRVGTKKTMWVNFAPICQALHRSSAHVEKFVFAELGSEGSVDANQRLIIKGRYVPKQMESLLRKYILEYVTCHMCKNPDTTLTRDPVTRLFFVQCESCGSRRSVALIRSGFHATSRTDRRQAKAAAK